MSRCRRSRPGGIAPLRGCTTEAAVPSRVGAPRLHPDEFVDFTKHRRSLAPFEPNSKASALRADSFGVWDLDFGVFRPSQRLQKFDQGSLVLIR